MLKCQTCHNLDKSRAMTLRPLAPAGKPDSRQPEQMGCEGKLCADGQGRCLSSAAITTRKGDTFAGRKVVGHIGQCQHADGPRRAGQEYIPVTQLVDAGAADDRNQGRCAARRVQCLGCVHEGNGRGNRKARGQNGSSLTWLAGNTHQSRKHMPAHKVAGLGQRAVGCAKGQHRRRAKRADEQGQVPFLCA